MKKKIVIVLILAMIVGLFTGCLAMSNERLVINVVYAKSKDADNIDPAEQTAVDEIAKLRENFPTLGEKGSGKGFYCGGENFSDKLASAAKDADIVVCIGEEFSDLSGVAASNEKVKWIWVGGDEAASSDQIYVIPADAEDGALLTKLTEYIEKGLDKDYDWAAAPESEESSTEETAEDVSTEAPVTEEAVTEEVSAEETAG